MPRKIKFIYICHGDLYSLIDFKRAGCSNEWDMTLVCNEKGNRFKIKDFIFFNDWINQGNNCRIYKLTDKRVKQFLKPWHERKTA